MTGSENQAFCPVCWIIRQPRIIQSPPAVGMRTSQNARRFPALFTRLMFSIIKSDCMLISAASYSLSWKVSDLSEKGFALLSAHLSLDEGNAKNLLPSTATFFGARKSCSCWTMLDTSRPRVINSVIMSPVDRCFIECNEIILRLRQRCGQGCNLQKSRHHWRCAFFGRLRTSFYWGDRTSFFPQPKGSKPVVVRE